MGDARHLGEQANLQRQARTRSVHEQHGVVVAQQLSWQLAKAKHIQSCGETQLKKEEPNNGIGTKRLDIREDGALVDQKHHKDHEELTPDQEPTDVLLVSGPLHQSICAGVSLPVVVLVRVLVLPHQNGHLQPLQQRQEHDAARKTNEHHGGHHPALPQQRLPSPHAEHQVRHVEHDHAERHHVLQVIESHLLGSHLLRLLFGRNVGAEDRFAKHIDQHPREVRANAGPL